MLGGGKASAAATYADKWNCTGAPYDNWGNPAAFGEGDGVMASLRVKAYSAADNKPINVDYRLESSSPVPSAPDQQIFNYANWQKYKNGTYNQSRDGIWRTAQQTFSTGEWLKGGANGPYKCNGWSVLAAGTTVKGYRIVGNGWVLDCLVGNNQPVNYRFSNLAGPDGESGYWTLSQYYPTLGKMVPDPATNTSVNRITPGSGGVSVDFNVKNGDNNLIHLVWHPDPTWKLRGHTGINKTTVKPGGSVKFDQTVSNDQGSTANYKWRISTKKLGDSGWTPGPWQSASGIDSGKKSPYQRVYQVDIPDTATTGQTVCQRIEYTNKFGGGASDPTRSTDSPANSNWSADDNDVKCATVAAQSTATGMCRYLYVKSRGAYKPSGGVERATRTLVKVDNVNVTEAAGKVTDYDNVPANSGVASSNDHMTSYKYNGTNTKFAAVPDDSGSKSQSDRLWKYQPTSQKIRVVILEQWWYPGGDNPATKKVVETDYNKGWYTISTSDQEYSCVTATCTVTVDGTGPVRRDGSGNIMKDEYGNELHYVVAGEAKGAKITATIKNTGASAQETRLFNTTFSYGGRTSDGTGKLAPGEIGYATLGDVDVPSAPNYTYPGHPELNYWLGTLSMSDSKISDLAFNPSCIFVVPLYKTFKVQPLAYTKLNPTEEAPTNFDYWGGAFTTNTTMPVTMNWGACTYREASESRDSDPCRDPKLKGELGRGTFTSTIDPPFKGNETNVAQPVQAGNQFCTIFDVEYTSGYIGSDGSIVDGIKDPAITPFDNCKAVKNKPYFKAYGKGVRAGGDFTGVCKTGGLLAGWNNTGGDNKGASSELSALALIKITGVASAQAKAGNSPTKLTFANNDPATIPSDPDSPYLGGNYATDADSERFCFDDVQPPAEATTPSGEPAAGAPGSQKYTNNGSPRVLSGATALATNQSVFVDGDVYIDSDIKYDNWSDPSNIPSFILRATGNIYINADVTQLDGMYVAGNKIYTCADSSTHKQKRSGNGVESGNNLYYECNQQLVVNGVFIAKQINMMRTFGSLRNAVAGENGSSASRACANGSNKNICAAEYFNFSPELYLAKPKIQSANGGTGKYDSIVSLPPVL